MFLSNLEYVPLRLLRKFIFTKQSLKRFGKFIPYYLSSQNQLDPKPIVDQYEKYLVTENTILKDKMILEIGVGATNSCGYEIIARKWGFVYSQEPYIEFDENNDGFLLNKLANEQNDEKLRIKSGVRRIKELKIIEDQSIDLILSNSVLEHVLEPQELFSELKRVLKNNGVMLHIVDYRDHFFKYPYHFLQFSKKIWNRFFNPGDLPVWRLDDYLQIIKELDLSIQILDQQVDKDSFEIIKPYISSDYDPSDTFIGVGFAILRVNKE